MLIYLQDRFTTDFFLPDGSYGTLVTGNYTSGSGDQVNLITGDFHAVSGEAGNIYCSNPLAQPNTASLSMPTPWTSKGIGTAIPASQLGGQSAHTTLVSGSRNATVLPSYTIPPTSLTPYPTVYTTRQPSITPPLSNDVHALDIRRWTIFMCWGLPALVLVISAVCSSV